MSFAKLSDTETSNLPFRRRSTTPAARPIFNTHITSDRLREGSGLRSPPFSMATNIRKGRKSVFREVGLYDEGPMAMPSTTPYGRNRSISSSTASDREGGEIGHVPTDRRLREEGSIKSPTLASERGQPTHQREHEDDGESESAHENNPEQEHEQNMMQSSKPWYSKWTSKHRPTVRSASSAPPPVVSSMQRFAMIALIIAIVLPGCSYLDANVDAEPIRPRQASSTQVCTRWAQQVAFLNGTLYMYGGQVKGFATQTTDTWNNLFVTLDLTKSWGTGSPPLTGLPVPYGPPAVSLGYLWNDYNNLYLYGGEFADNPYVLPAPVATWRYSIRDRAWTKFDNPQTSAGNYSEPSGIPVQRSAEGAGLSVPELGLSWYFGGHQDLATTPGWSNQIGRIYLNSLLEFTHPGYSNNGVWSLIGAGAPDGGTYRNITKGGVQSGFFPERADGVLIFVPGWGESGVLIGLGGGTEFALTHDPSVLDVYDISSSEWFRQKTTGEAPSPRVNPCAVIASAPDASSFQIYFFGGQNLVPAGSTEPQTQYNDMYILSIPAFTWMRVQNDGKNIPAPRAGHTCTMRDGQMLVVGGYVGKNIPCDSPGIYVFDATSLQWKDGFKAGDHPPDLHPENSVLAGSHGYKVPAQVQKVIGGDSEGGATATTPAAGRPSLGPFATGRPPVFTITRGDKTETITSWGTGPTDGSSPNGLGPQTGGVNAGLVAAGVIAGILGVLAGYLGFCSWVYKRQVAAYKQHLAVANRYSGASTASLGGGRGAAVAGLFGRGRGRNASQESFSWVGSPVEPKWMSDGPTPGSNSGSGSGSNPMVEDRRADYSYQGAGTEAGAKEADRASMSSTEQLLNGQEPSFFSVVMGPRRALRVVNGLD